MRSSLTTLGGGRSSLLTGFNFNAAAKTGEALLSTSAYTDLGLAVPIARTGQKTVFLSTVGRLTNRFRRLGSKGQSRPLNEHPGSVNRYLFGFFVDLVGVGGPVSGAIMFASAQILT